MIQRIGIVFAMEREAAGLIAALELTPLSPWKATLPMRGFVGKIRECEIFVILAGSDSRYEVDNVGTNAAVLSAYLLIEHFRPDILLSAGTAGGFYEKGMRIGEVYLCQDRVFFHDRRNHVPKYAEYIDGKYPIHPTPAAVTALGLKTALLSTGNSLDCSPDDHRKLELSASQVKDMEGAAVGWVCWTMGVAFLPIKSVTDYIEQAETAGDQFLKNFTAAASALTEKVLAFLYFAANRPLDGL